MASDFLKALDERFNNGVKEFADALKDMMTESEKAKEAAPQKNTPSIEVESIVVDENILNNDTPVVGKEDIKNDGEER